MGNLGVLHNEGSEMKEKTFMKKYGMLLMILGVAAVTRLAGLGKIPEGILPDEACAAYNAWALMT